MYNITLDALPYMNWMNSMQLKYNRIINISTPGINVQTSPKNDI